MALRPVHSFACQLQNLDLAAASRSPFDLLIVDYAVDGLTPYSAAQVAGLRRGGRRVFAYLSVGEAESYRFYWRKEWKPGSPPWLLHANPDWPENYRVRYWAPEWQAILREYLSRIQDAGYDGAFLDVVDAYVPLAEAGDRQARPRMAELIRQLKLQGGPNFELLLNGGEGLASEPGVVQWVSGVVKEEIFYGLGGDDRPSPPDFTLSVQQALKPWTDAGKLVLSIDYTSRPAQMLDAHRRARAAGYLEYVAPRGLDRLVQQPVIPERPE